MGETTKIEWCDATFNPWVGCQKVSAGCKSCYASVGTTARVSASRGLPLWGGEESTRQITSLANWRKPIRWNKEAAAAGASKLVFCASLADVFEDRDDLLVPRARLYALISETPWLTWLLVTKRPQNADRMLRAAAGLPLALTPTLGNPWLRNIWLGTTCEDQANADERLPHLIAVPAAVRFVSYEPAIGPVVFRDYLAPGDHAFKAGRAIDWVIVGGESGHGARPFSLNWALSTIEQCRWGGAAPFVKQLGSRPVDSLGEPLKFKHSKAGDWDEWPEVLRVREWPVQR
jgi:protein gp37